MLCFNVKRVHWGRRGQAASFCLVLAFFLFFFDKGENTPAKEMNLGCE